MDRSRLALTPSPTGHRAPWIGLLLAIGCAEGDLVHRAPVSPTDSPTNGSATGTVPTGSTTTSTSPDWLDVSTEDIACGVLYDGTSHCFGGGMFFTQPESFPDTTDAVQIEMSFAFGCTLDSVGALTCFGCEDGTDPSSCDPRPGTFTLLKGSSYSMCALRDDDTLFCWEGGNDVSFEGPIGNFDVGAAGVAVLPPGGGLARWYPENVATAGRPAQDLELLDIALDSRHSCGILLDGTVECWGEDSNQLPYPSPDDPGPFVQIETTGGPTCARRVDGTVHCWAGEGYDDSWPNQLAVPQDEHFVHIDMGWFDACGMRADGTAWCWGREDIASWEGEWIDPDWL